MSERVFQTKPSMAKCLVSCYLLSQHGSHMAFPSHAKQVLSTILNTTADDLKTRKKGMKELSDWKGTKYHSTVPLLNCN